MSDIFKSVRQIVTEHLGIAEDKVQMESSFVEDLGADSLDQVEIVMALEEKFGISVPDDVAEKIRTVEDVVKYIEQASKN